MVSLMIHIKMSFPLCTIDLGLHICWHHGWRKKAIKSYRYICNRYLLITQVSYHHWAFKLVALLKECTKKLVNMYYHDNNVNMY